MFRVPEEVLKEGFQEVIDQDFNPDIVKCFGIDMWNDGFKSGILIGVAATAGMTLGIYLGNKIANKHITKRKSEFTKMAEEFYIPKDLKLK